MTRGAWAVLAAGLLAAPQAFGQGLVREPDTVYRGFQPTVRFRAFLPAEVDLTAAFPTPGTQGQQPSCTAWAVGYALRSYYEHWRRGWDINDASHIVSPAFIYDRLAGPDSKCANGTSISDALNLLQTVGAPSLADVPYDPQKCWFDTPPATAATFRIREFQRVDLGDLDNVKGELHNGNPVVFGMNLSESFDHLSGDQIYDDTDSPRTIGHALVLVGYSEKRQAFKFMNSWGANWGDGGFGWVSYRAFTKLVDRAFVARVDGLPVLADFLATLTPNGRANQPAQTIVPTPAVAIMPAIPPPPVVATPAIVPAPAVKPPPKVVPTPAVEPAPKITPAPAVTPSPKPVPARMSVAALRQELTRFECSDVKLDQSPGHGPRIAGFVSSDADRARLQTLLASVDAASRPATEIAVRPWPQCEALLAFAAPLSHPRGLNLLVNGAKPDTLHGGEALAIDVTAPDFPSYIYVTYVQSSGDALHLLAPAGTLSRAVAPHTHIRIGGGGPGQPDLKIAAPFGQEMIVVIAAASPLFTEPRPDQEFERDFLTAFRAALLTRSAGGESGRVVAAAVALLRTVPGP